MRKGGKRLRLPGIPEEDRPVVPPNVSITATVHTAECAGVLHTDVLRQAGVIAFRAGRVNNVMWRRPHQRRSDYNACGCVSVSVIRSLHAIICCGSLAQLSGTAWGALNRWLRRSDARVYR
jgi:hypothetical protein